MELSQIRSRLLSLIDRHGGKLRLRGADRAIAYAVRSLRERHGMKRGEAAQALGISRNQLDYLLGRGKDAEVTLKPVQVVQPVVEQPVAKRPATGVVLVLPNAIRVECIDTAAAIDFSRQWR